mmetsp:Transcript_6026/g.9971  ORF Transcript_6026/g.9971 Transcript_6026/m.9971 type:complete len:212 (+) Transcript_6026:441-1076(+)
MARRAHHGRDWMVRMVDRLLDGGRSATRLLRSQAHHQGALGQVARARDLHLRRIAVGRQHLRDGRRVARRRIRRSLRQYHHGGLQGQDRHQRRTPHGSRHRPRGESQDWAVAQQDGGRQRDPHRRGGVGLPVRYVDRGESQRDLAGGDRGVPRLQGARGYGRSQALRVHASSQQDGTAADASHQQVQPVRSRDQHGLGSVGAGAVFGRHPH